MSQELDRNRQFYLNDIMSNYVSNLDRDEANWNNLIIDESNAGLISDINSYIKKFITGNETLNNVQKYKRYKELYKHVNSYIKELKGYFHGNSLNSKQLYNSLRTATMPILDEIATTIHELTPPPKAIPIVETISAPVEPPSEPTFVDRFRSMFSSSTPKSDIIDAGQANNGLQTAVPFIGENNTFLTVAKPIKEKPTNLSPRAGLNIQTRPAESTTPTVPTVPTGGGAAPEDYTSENTTSTEFSFV